MPTEVRYKPNLNFRNHPISFIREEYQRKNSNWYLYIITKSSQLTKGCMDALSIVINPLSAHEHYRIKALTENTLWQISWHTGENTNPDFLKSLFDLPRNLTKISRPNWFYGFV